MFLFRCAPALRVSRVGIRLSSPPALHTEATPASCCPDGVGRQSVLLDAIFSFSSLVTMQSQLVGFQSRERLCLEVLRTGLKCENDQGSERHLSVTEVPKIVKFQGRK